MFCHKVPLSLARAPILRKLVSPTNLNQIFCLTRYNQSLFSSATKKLGAEVLNNESKLNDSILGNPKGSSSEQTLSKQTKSDPNKPVEHEAYSEDNTLHTKGSDSKGEKAKSSMLPGDKYRNIHSLVLLRVIRTCLIYLDSSNSEREALDDSSRFYYVKQTIERMDFNTLKSFRTYLTQYNQFMYKKGEVEPISENLEVLTDDSEKTWEDIKTPKIWYRDFSKKKVQIYLSEPENGQILSKLILEFLSEENPDYRCYLDEKQDEISLGKFGKRSRKIGERARKVLTTFLDETRSDFRDIMSF